MIKQKKVLLGIVFLINGFRLMAMQEPQALVVKEFDHAKDAVTVEKMLTQSCSQLFGSSDFDVGRMLSARTLTPQVVDSYNSLTMHVLKRTVNDSIVSFVAFETSNQHAFIRLLATAAHERRIGCASALLAHLINSLSIKKVAQVTFETRAQNAGAVALYEKLLRSRNDISYSKTPITVPNKDIKDVIRYEISFK